MLCLCWPYNQSTWHLTGMLGSIICQQGAWDVQGHRLNPGTENWKYIWERSKSVLADFMST